MKLQKKIKTALVILISVSIFVNAYAAKIYLIGDSTVSTYNSGYFPMAGWGQMLQYFLNSDSIIVVNKAIGGRSSKSFYNDHWSYIRDVLEPGDYVFVQFGINDANSEDTARYAPANTLFKDYLTKFVNETQEKGATCVLVATLRRNAWNATIPPTMYDAYHDYPIVTRTLAGELNVPLIDLDEACKTLMEPLSPSYVGPFMYMNLDAGIYPVYPGGLNDNTHFQEMGAIEIARLVVEEMEGLGDFPEMAKLIPYINPMYEVAITSNMPDEAIITRTASYPEGLYVTLKTKPNLGYDLVEWQDTLGNVQTTENLFRFKMDTSAVAYKAILGEHHDIITIQEDETGFCGIDGLVESSYSGFTGIGYAIPDDSSGAGIDWQIDVSLGGSYTFEWRFANGSSDQLANLLVNGDTVLSDINFPGTDDWTNWDTTTVDVDLEVGMQEIRLEAVSDNGLANIDYFKVSGSVVRPATCGSNSVVSGTVYRIINKNSGKALQVADVSTSNAASVNQGKYTGGTHQQWMVTATELEYYSLIAQHSGQYLDVYGKRTTDGADVIQYPSNGGFNQQWAITYIDSVWFKIVARHSEKCLDVANSSTAEGANVQQMTYSGKDNQLWQFVLASEPVKIAEPDPGVIPDGFTLEQNYPNPFNPVTAISYQLPVDSKVELSIYNILGQKVATLVNRKQAAGKYEMEWDASGFASGVYIYTLKTSRGFKQSRKLVVLK